MSTVHRTTHGTGRTKTRQAQTKERTAATQPYMGLSAYKPDPESRLRAVIEEHKRVVRRKNLPSKDLDPAVNPGWAQRWERPVLTSAHVPLNWVIDLNRKTNPHRMVRLGINAVFNSGALAMDDGTICLVARVEGFDRKSFFAVARSRTGVDGFTFDPLPVRMHESGLPATNVYDMRLTRHEDGWIYGIFCVERLPAEKRAKGDLINAEAAAGVVRTRDLVTWDRLPDIVSVNGAGVSMQQRNVVLHPKFVDGKYGLYTRPMAGFIGDEHALGIGWALVESMENARIDHETVVDPREYHTLKEVKNGAGGVPLETPEGWVHIAHGVRNTAAGLRYVLYAFMCDRDDPSRVIYRPGGYFLAPQGAERVGDVSNVAFTNGVVARGENVFIYYGASDTTLHVATTTIPQLLDYLKNTPEDALVSAGCVEQRIELIRANARFLTRYGL